MGLPWRSSGQDSTLPLQGTRVRSLVSELRSHKPHSVAEKKRKILNKEKIWVKEMNRKQKKLKPKWSRNIGKVTQTCISYWVKIITIGNHLFKIRLAVNKKSHNMMCWQDVEKGEHSYFLAEVYTMVPLSGEKFGSAC